MTKKAVLNRPVVTQRTFDSSALGVLTTLFHRFVEEGEYDVKIRHVDSEDKAASGAVVRRFRVRVDNAGKDQENVDLATPRRPEADCSCHEDASFHLRVDGVMGFFVSRGTSRFSVEITLIGKESKRVVVDSANAVAGGDLFAVTLVRPGAYRATHRLAEGGGKGSMAVAVASPKARAGYRHNTAEASLVVVGEDGEFSQGEASLQSGQSLVFQPAADGRFQIKLKKDETGEDGDPKKGSAARRTHRYRKPTVSRGTT